MPTLTLFAAAASSAPASAVASAAAKATDKQRSPDLSDFLNLCLDRVELLDTLAGGMIVAALLLAFASGAVSIYASYLSTKQAPNGGADAEDNALKGFSSALAEAISKLLETLGKLPIWFALFVGGFALFWLASELSDGQCGNKPVLTAAESPASGAAESGGNEPEEKASESPAAGKTGTAAEPG